MFGRPAGVLCCAARAPAAAERNTRRFMLRLIVCALESKAQQKCRLIALAAEVLIPPARIADLRQQRHATHPDADSRRRKYPDGQIRSILPSARRRART